MGSSAGFSGIEQACTAGSPVQDGLAASVQKAPEKSMMVTSSDVLPLLPPMEDTTRSSTRKSKGMLASMMVAAQELEPNTASASSDTTGDSQGSRWWPRRREERGGVKTMKRRTIKECTKPSLVVDESCLALRREQVLKELRTGKFVARGYDREGRVLLAFQAHKHRPGEAPTDDTIRMMEFVADRALGAAAAR
eukprot:CAMPEP_0194682446 /NCGR_PEP_ID=MMETSP0295-20121207/12771_1 /TAXON_ID=39354 /ORGANISM="Heterosigma akashiwo, Strain CCMP2393" /LENGTH=193 /DNA_ID=CAMNT_0039568799 /DNA_START=214 /DNA_END=791 /DNA_ORIENTATION=+